MTQRATIKDVATRLATAIFQREPNGITVLFNNAGASLVVARFSHPFPYLSTLLSSKYAGIGRGSSKPIANKAATNAEEFVKTYFDPVTQEDFTDSLNVNAVGPYWLTFAFLPLLEKWKNSEEGKKFVPQVIMTSSMNGWTKVRFLDIDRIAFRAILTFLYD